MSFSLAIADGDLVQVGSQLDLVFGVDKLKQDIDLWLRERYGNDRFHVTMGSTLQEYIGGIVSPNTKAEIQGEVLRVLQNYQAVQFRKLKQTPQALSNSELLVSIDSIQTTIYYDTVSVMVRLRNGSDTTTTINVTSRL